MILFSCWNTVINSTEVIRLQRAEPIFETRHNEYTFYLLEYFHYYKALAYYKLDDTVRFESELFKTIEILNLIEIEKRKKFEDVILKDTGKNIRDFYLEKLKQQS